MISELAYLLLTWAINIPININIPTINIPRILIFFYILKVKWYLLLDDEGQV